MSQNDNKDLDAWLDVEEQTAQDLDRTFWRFAREILRYPGLIGLCALSVLLSTGASILEPRLFGYAIDAAIIPKDWSLLKILVVIYFGAEILRVGTTITSGWLFSHLGQRVMQDLRLKLFSHLQRLPVSIYDKTPAGKLVTRVTNDISALADMFSSGLITIIQNILVVVGTLAGILLLNFQLGLTILLTFPIMVVLSIYFSNQLRIAYRNARSKLSALNAFIAENILGMRVTHLFNRSKIHLEKYARLNAWYAEAQFKTVRVFAMFHPTIAIATGLTMASAIWFGGKMVQEQVITIGVLVAAFAYILALFQPIRDIADKWNLFLSGMASAERVFSILQWPTEVSENRSSSEPTGTFRGHIKFENIWFAYKDEQWVLRDFSFEAMPGQQIGIVGPTGSGKTTLISLLMRFYEPQRGRILLDGKDIREYDKQDLRRLIGIVQQDVFLFSGSIRDNISLWRGFSLDEAPAFARLSGSPRFASLMESLDQKLNERGMNLSMGERQLVAFARALCSNPLIWILDEATANVDSTTEKEFEHLLEHCSKGRTSLLIAHRLSTIRNADQILVLNKGQLVESGNHEFLMNKNGLYSLLYRYNEAEKSLLNS